MILSYTKFNLKLFLLVQCFDFSKRLNPIHLIFSFSLQPREEIVMVVCPNCGISSRHLQRCDRCKKKIPENSKTVKYSQVKKEVITVKKSDSNLTLEKRQFYSKNISDQVSAFSSPESLSKSTSIGCSTDIVKPAQYSRVRIIPRNRKTNTLHNIKPHVPGKVLFFYFLPLWKFFFLHNDMAAVFYVMIFIISGCNGIKNNFLFQFQHDSL